MQDQLCGLYSIRVDALGNTRLNLPMAVEALSGGENQSRGLPPDECQVVPKMQSNPATCDIGCMYGGFAWSFRHPFTESWTFLTLGVACRSIQY